VLAPGVEETAPESPVDEESSLDAPESSLDAPESFEDDESYGSLDVADDVSAPVDVVVVDEVVFFATLASAGSSPS
jgi:hypothetical protein